MATSNGGSVDASAQPAYNVFRFMDLPLEIRRMIYNVATKCDSVIFTWDIIDYIEGKDSLVNIVNVSKAIRKEAFQSFVQSNIINISKIESFGSDQISRLFFAKSADMAIEAAQKYIDDNKLDFDFLANIHSARIEVPDRGQSTIEGLEVLKHCSNIRTLVIDLEYHSYHAAAASGRKAKPGRIVGEIAENIPTNMVGEVVVNTLVLEMYFGDVKTETAAKQEWVKQLQVKMRAMGVQSAVKLNMKVDDLS